MAAEVVTWVDVDGTETTLSQQDTITVLLGRQGAYMPPFRVVEEVVPEQAGTRLRMCLADAREVDLPVQIRGADAHSIRTSLRGFMRSMNPLDGDGTLKVQGPGGDVRELTCRLIDGLTGDESQDNQGVTFLNAVLVFRAVDPYWYASSASVADYTVSTPATFFPFFPMRLSSGTIFADTSVANGGDVEAWPVWTIQGPGSDPVLRNLTTGKIISMTHTVGGGETVTIDTRVGTKTVTGNDGTNLFNTMSSTSSLWSLGKGTTSIRLEMTDATADSYVRLSYTPRYLGV